MTPQQIVEQIAKLDEKDQHRLQSLCGVLAKAFGERATTRAVLVFTEGPQIAFALVNTTEQQAHDMLTQSAELFREYYVVEIPPKEMLN